MSVRHHPDEALLLAHAAGSLDPAMTLILASHLSFCAQCRNSVTRFEQVGAALLEGIEPIATADDALARTMARLGKPEAARTAPPPGDGTPPPLGAFLGRDISGLRWRSMGPRLGYVTLYRHGSMAMRLLRGAPGTHVGLHSHRDAEYTLVLRGGFSDETGHYGPGDFQAATPDVTHDPVADPGEDCINLAVTTDRLRFPNAAQAFVARLFGF